MDQYDGRLNIGRQEVTGDGFGSSHERPNRKGAGQMGVGLKILIASRIDPNALARLAEENSVIEAWDADPERLRLLIRDCDAIVFRSGVSITADLMAEAPRLALVIRGGSGIDNLDLDYVADHQIELVRIPGPGARAVAEMTFALMLGLARQVLFADRQWRQGRWVKNEVEGHLLVGKTLGVVGAGKIGGIVGELGAAWGMIVLGCVNESNPQRQSELSQRGIHLTSFAEVIARADFLCVHLPLNDTTRNLIGAKQIRAMKPGAMLINLARGGIVDEAALRDALLDGHIRGAALDVHANEGEGMISPLADLTNVILTPHIGATTIDTQRMIGQRIVEAVELFLRGGDASEA